MSETLELDDIQGLLTRGYGNLPAATFLLLEIEAPLRARAWLRRLAERITSAGVRPEDRALNVALTASALTKLGFPTEAMARFSREFAGGMVTSHRSRFLGDVGDGSPEHWHWGGPTTRPVDVLLLVYARDETLLTGLVDDLATGVAEGGLAPVEQLVTAPLTDREHFGFRDGISQPTIEGLGRTDAPANTIKAGEFVLGYKNEYGLYTDRPVLEPADDPGGLLPTTDSGRRDFGRNGSYLVIRQLGQDVHGFWQFLDGVTRGDDGASDPLARTWLAAKMVGRWPNGAPMAISPDVDDPHLADFNDFGYGTSDRDGLNCPIGAHIRRTRPRDSLDPDPGTDRSIELDKRHRLLRRGRDYGPPVAPEELLIDADGDGPRRGLHFICLCANIARQFEFVQHTWVSNQKFDGLYDEVDPLIGRRDPSGATFTIPRRPVRRRIRGIPSFVAVHGGGYFFMPGLRALRYLARLPS